MKTDPFLRAAQLGIRLTPKERQALDAAALKDGRKTSDWARVTLLRAAGIKPGRRVA